MKAGLASIHFGKNGNILLPGQSLNPPRDIHATQEFSSKLTTEISAQDNIAQSFSHYCNPVITPENNEKQAVFGNIEHPCSLYFGDILFEFETADHAKRAFNTLPLKNPDFTTAACMTFDNRHYLLIPYTAIQPFLYQIGFTVTEWKPSIFAKAIGRTGGFNAKLRDIANAQLEIAEPNGRITPTEKAPKKNQVTSASWQLATNSMSLNRSYYPAETLIPVLFSQIKTDAIDPEEERKLIQTQYNNTLNLLVPAGLQEKNANGHLDPKNNWMTDLQAARTAAYYLSEYHREKNPIQETNTILTSAQGYFLKSCLQKLNSLSYQESDNPVVQALKLHILRTAFKDGKLNLEHVHNLGGLVQDHDNFVKAIHNAFGENSPLHHHQRMKTALESPHALELDDAVIRTIAASLKKEPNDINNSLVKLIKQCYPLTLSLLFDPKAKALSSLVTPTDILTSLPYLLKERYPLRELYAVPDLITKEYPSLLGAVQKLLSTDKEAAQQFNEQPVLTSLSTSKNFLATKEKVLREYYLKDIPVFYRGKNTAVGDYIKTRLIPRNEAVSQSQSQSQSQPQPSPSLRKTGERRPGVMRQIPTPLYPSASSPELSTRTSGAGVLSSSASASVSEEDPVQHPLRNSQEMRDDKNQKIKDDTEIEMQPPAQWVNRSSHQNGNGNQPGQRR